MLGAAILVFLAAFILSVLAGADIPSAGAPSWTVTLLPKGGAA